MKKIILILLVSLLIPFTTYAEQIIMKPHAIVAYKDHIITKDNKLFEGNTNDVLCFDSDEKLITIFCGYESNSFKIVKIDTSDNERIDFYTIDENNRKVCITIHSFDNDTVCAVYISYPNVLLTYFVKMK